MIKTASIFLIFQASLWACQDNNRDEAPGDFYGNFVDISFYVPPKTSYFHHEDRDVYLESHLNRCKKDRMVLDHLVKNGKSINAYGYDDLESQLHRVITVVLRSDRIARVEEGIPVAKVQDKSKTCCIRVKNWCSQGTLSVERELFGARGICLKKEREAELLIFQLKQKSENCLGKQKID